MELLDRILVCGSYPIGILMGIYYTLLGFGIVRARKPDKGDEASLSKRLRMLRWLGPVIAIGFGVMFIHGILNWK